MGVLKYIQRSKKGRLEACWNRTESPCLVHMQWGEIFGFLARKLQQAAMQEEFGKMIPKVQARQADP